MRMALPIAWYPACRWKPRLTPETAGENERDCAFTRFRAGGADAALPTDFHTMARTHCRAHGHLHIDLKWAIVHVRSRRHTRRGGRRIRRGGMDYHRANRGADADYDSGRLDGRDFRPATSIDRCVHRLCTDFLADPLFAQPAHVIDDAVLGRSGHGVFHSAHLELHIAQRAA